MIRSAFSRRVKIKAAIFSMMMMALLAAAPRAHGQCCVIVDVSKFINCAVTVDIVDNITGNMVYGQSYLPGARDFVTLPCPFNYTARIWGPHGPVAVPFGSSLPIWIEPGCCVLVRTAQDDPALGCWVIHVEPC